MIGLHQKHDLGIVAQIITQGKSPAEHLTSLEERFKRALEFKRLHINSRTGLLRYYSVLNLLTNENII